MGVVSIIFSNQKSELFQAFLLHEMCKNNIFLLTFSSLGFLPMVNVFLFVSFLSSELSFALTAILEAVTCCVAKVGFVWCRGTV